MQSHFHISQVNASIALSFIKKSRFLVIFFFISLKYTSNPRGFQYTFDHVQYVKIATHYTHMGIESSCQSWNNQRGRSQGHCRRSAFRGRKIEESDRPRGIGWEVRGLWNLQSKQYFVFEIFKYVLLLEVR